MRGTNSLISENTKHVANYDLKRLNLKTCKILLVRKKLETILEVNWYVRNTL